MLRYNMTRICSRHFQILAFALTLLLTSCFEIFQTIEESKDGKIQMAVRTTMAVNGQLTSEISSKSAYDTTEAKQKITKHIVGSLKEEILSDNLMTRHNTVFMTNRKLLMPDKRSIEDKLFFLPITDGPNQWLFVFNALMDSTNQSQDNSYNFNSWLDTAVLYRILFRGVYKPKIAIFSSINGSTHNLTITSLADGVMIDFPFFVFIKGGVLTISTKDQIDYKRTNEWLQKIKQEQSEKKNQQKSEKSDLSPKPINSFSLFFILDSSPLCS